MSATTTPTVAELTAQLLRLQAQLAAMQAPADAPAPTPTVTGPHDCAGCAKPGLLTNTYCKQCRRAMLKAAGVTTAPIAAPIAPVAPAPKPAIARVQGAHHPRCADGTRVGGPCGWCVNAAKAKAKAAERRATAGVTPTGVSAPMPVDVDPPAEAVAAVHDVIRTALTDADKAGRKPTLTEIAARIVAAGLGR